MTRFDDEFDIDTFDTSYTDWIDSMSDDQIFDHCSVFCDKHHEEFQRHLREVYRPIFDRLLESQRSECDGD